MAQLLTMDAAYFNPLSASSFGGVQRLQRETKNSLRDVKDWLSGVDAYTLHKPVRLRFRRRVHLQKELMTCGK